VRWICWILNRLSCIFVSCDGAPIARGVLDVRFPRSLFSMARTAERQACSVWNAVAYWKPGFILYVTRLVTTPVGVACIVETGYWALRAELIIYLCWFAVKPRLRRCGEVLNDGGLEVCTKEKRDVFCYVWLIKEIYVETGFQFVGLYLIEYCKRDPLYLLHTTMTDGGWVFTQYSRLTETSMLSSSPFLSQLQPFIRPRGSTAEPEIIENRRPWHRRGWRQRKVDRTGGGRTVYTYRKY